MPTPKPAPKEDAVFTIGRLPQQRWQVGAGVVSTLRPNPPPRPVIVDARPAAVEFDLARAALVVVDMQNDFCHPDGWFARKGVDVAPLRVPIAAINALTGPMREASAPVVWVNWGVRADAANLPASTLFRGKRTVDAAGYGEVYDAAREGALVRGSWGAATFDGLDVKPDDIEVCKHRFSGFPDSELDSVLRNLGATTLLFAGINIDRCVFATLTDASAHGYDCVLVRDACATPSPQTVAESAAWLVELLYGFVATTPAVLQALSRASLPSQA